LRSLSLHDNVQLLAFPPDFIAAARSTAAYVLDELATRSATARKVHDSYVGFRDRIAAWSRISLQAVLEAREG
jgi:TRAP-type mannitol/chloroaromatic compound transport system substrate-binding protein